MHLILLQPDYVNYNSNANETIHAFILQPPAYVIMIVKKKKQYMHLIL